MAPRILVSFWEKFNDICLPRRRFFLRMRRKILGLKTSPPLWDLPNRKSILYFYIRSYTGTTTRRGIPFKA